eukprot:TRINITY_DN59563_c0_g1_i1.p1 TRINITY_DN59563_c0_g1~~TRINITY_DN59563_c0_g1_i1.p1  ORF type:complete len:154 (+),score=25.31 TRINITY_DN59563_c0_g1_i1:61-522(+)
MHFRRHGGGKAIDLQALVRPGPDERAFARKEAASQIVQTVADLIFDGTPSQSTTDPEVVSAQDTQRLPSLVAASSSVSNSDAPESNISPEEMQPDDLISTKLPSIEKKTEVAPEPKVPGIFEPVRDHGWVWRRRLHGWQAKDACGYSPAFVQH